MVDPTPDDVTQPRREQYVAHDTRTGLEVAVTGQFPDDPDDRVRIARTTTLFTRLMSTILDMDSITQRREGFRAVETQLEVAEALMRGDLEEVQSLIRDTMNAMGVTEDQLGEIERELRRHLGGLAGPDAEGDEDVPRL
ncbi:MAG: hypothetical protein AB7I38_10255 [Dehalococcoidia bacterium]